jgi:AraC family transcriptional regulator
VYLASTFRDKYGHSILDYLRQLRVEYASRQLSDSNDSLAAIAQAAGFSDQSHFSRIFKRVTGVTPAVYRASSEKGRKSPKNL